MHFLRKIIYKIYHHKIIFINYPLELVHNILSRNLKILSVNQALKKLNIKSENFEIYKKELIENLYLNEIFSKFEDDVSKYSDYKNKIENNVQYQIIYSVIRDKGLENILTTGVAEGNQEAIILAALNKNKNGKLYSVDLPGKKGHLTYDKNLRQEEIGIKIPIVFKNRFQLILDDSRLILPQLFKDLKFNLFIHDSNHTKIHMNLEYYLARSFLTNNSLIFSDDILIYNNSFENFLTHNNIYGFCIKPKLNFGFIANNLKSDYEIDNSLERYYKGD